MPEHLTIDSFSPRLGELFNILLEDGTRLPVKLTEVTSWGGRPSEDLARIPFTLGFHTVPEAVITQGTYRVENGAMGTLELFLVPRTPDERGMRYEAVFA